MKAKQIIWKDADEYSLSKLELSKELYYHISDLCDDFSETIGRCPSLGFVVIFGEGEEVQTFLNWEEPCKTLEEAKELAQKDWETRLMKCLEII
jgi:hypothetical protein